MNSYSTHYLFENETNDLLATNQKQSIRYKDEDTMNSRYPIQIESQKNMCSRKKVKHREQERKAS